MATIIQNKDKSGNVISYKFRCVLGRDESYKQIQRTKTIKRPEGLTPARERKEVQRIAAEWEEEQKAEYRRTNEKESKDKITFSTFLLEHWWKDHVMDGTHTPTTIAFYKHMSDDLITYFGEKKRLNQIDGETVKRYIKYLRNEAQTKTGKPYSLSTQKSHYTTLDSILEYARRFRYIKANPCEDLSPKEKPHKESKKIDFLTSDEAREFINALDNEPLFWRCFMNLLITTGIRRGEAVGLQWGDIDSDKLTLKIERNITPDKDSPNKMHIGTTKTKGARVVPLSARVHRMLTELKDEMQTRYGAVVLTTAFIFCAESDPYKPIYPTAPTTFQRRFIKRHNLPNVSPHDLRHTAATLALESGANLKEVQELLGHADPSTTMSFYTGVSEEAQRRTVEGIEALIG